jgi:hypothetical protein
MASLEGHLNDVHGKQVQANLSQRMDENVHMCRVDLTGRKAENKPVPTSRVRNPGIVTLKQH